MPAYLPSDPGNPYRGGTAYNAPGSLNPDSTPLQTGGPGQGLGGAQYGGGSGGGGGGLAGAMGLGSNDPSQQYYGGSANQQGAAEGYFMGGGQAAQDRGGPQMNSGYGQDVNQGIGGQMGMGAGQTQYGADSGAYGAGMGQQGQALGLLAAAANGNAPSAAQIQMGQGIDASINAQMAMANSSRATGPAAAAQARQVADQGAMARMQGVNQSAELRAQEMAQARGAYMQGAGQMTGMALQSRAQALQAMGMSQAQAYQQAQMDLAKSGQNDQYSLGMYGLGQNVGLAGLSAAEQNQQLQQQNNQFNAGQNTKVLAGGLQAAGSMMTTSDAYAKHAIVEGDKSSGHVMSDAENKTTLGPRGRDGAAMDRLLGPIRPVTYAYKRPEVEGGGRHFGLLAQDLERSPEGQAMVRDTPRGKMVDGGKAALAGLAAASDLHDRVSALERRAG